jgi:hypothetical protein
MASSGMLRRVALVKTDVSQELTASLIRLSVRRVLVTANVFPTSPILVTLMMEALRSSIRRLLQTPHCVKFQKTAFFIVVAVKTTNLT